MSLPPASNGPQGANGREGPLSDQAKLLEALRQQTVRQQLAQYSAQKEAAAVPAPAVVSAEEEGTYTLASLGGKKIHEIKDILRLMGKKVTGNKEDLIARILGLEESVQTPTKSKKRHADDMADGEGSGDEDEDGDMPPAKKFKVDRNDPIWAICFICKSKDELNKYKDIRMCTKCKLYWKGKRLTPEDAEHYFLLKTDDLAQLPHKEGAAVPSAPPVPLYAFATCAGAAVRKFGALYNMVNDHPNEREVLAQRVMAERRFLEEEAAKQPPAHSADFDHASAEIHGAHHPGHFNPNA